MIRPTRARSNTVSISNPSSQEIIKRKREEEKELKETFSQSKKTARSPIKIQTSTTRETASDMEEMMKIMKDIKETMEKGFRDNNAEIIKLRAEIKENEQQWKKDKKELEDKINKLENRIKQKERDDRRNNIVIKGIKVKGENIEAEVERMIKETVGVEIKVREAYKIAENQDRDIVLAKLEKSRHKNMVMRNKAKLRGTDWYVENDLSKEEQEIQRVIVKRAKEERNKGARTTIGYRKLIIDGEKYMWNDTEKNLQKVRESKN